MPRSKHAIPDHNILILIGSILCAGAIFILPPWLWQRAVFFAHEKGPSIVEKRLTHLFAREVQVQAVNLSFPPTVSIEGFEISSDNETEFQIKAKRLEIKFSLLTLFSRQIKPREITLISPDIKLIQTTEGSLALSRVKIFRAINNREIKIAKQGWPASMKPSSWPITVHPEQIKIIGGKLQLEDESDTIPQLSGRFNLNITRDKSAGSNEILSGKLSLENTSFFYHGLTGKLSGTVDFSPKFIKTIFHCQPVGGGALDIQSNMSKAKKIPKCSFEIKADDYDLKNLALLKFPLGNIPENTIVSGNFSADSPLLYGKRFSYLSAGISRRDGTWSIKAIKLRLTDNQGIITGSIIPENSKESSLTKATLSYTGKITPNIQTFDEELTPLNTNQWETPITITSELTLDLASYPLQITTIKLMGDNGDIFANGSIDLFSGFITMTGTYLKPLLAGKHTSKDIQNNVIKISLSGPINRPVLRISPGTR